MQFTARIIEALGEFGRETLLSCDNDSTFNPSDLSGWSSAIGGFSRGGKEFHSGTLEFGGGGVR